MNVKTPIISKIHLVILFVFLLMLWYLSFFVIADSLYLDDIVVFEKDGIYHIRIITEMTVAEEHVRQVLTDYVHIYRLSDSIIESEVLELSVDRKTRVKSVILCAIPVVCNELTLVEEVSTLDSGDLQSVILPGKSDFRSGKALWQITSKGEKTQLTYQASIEPDVFIPPIVGTKIVITNMRNEYKIALNRIERIARINEAREWDEDFSFVNIDDSTDGEPCSN